VTATVTVTVNRLGALGPGCASCGLLYGCYEARRVEGWLSMLLRQGRLYCLPAGVSTLRPVDANSRLLNAHRCVEGWLSMLLRQHGVQRWIRWIRCKMCHCYSSSLSSFGSETSAELGAKSDRVVLYLSSPYSE
jgi:hypothetical protein